LKKPVLNSKILLNTLWGGVMQERRAYVRTPLAVSLEILSPGNEMSIGKGFVTNLSETGVALETAKHFASGEKLLLRFSLPKNFLFNLVAEVKYVKEGIFSRAYGVSFESADMDSSERLRNFVTQHV
jgi:hypothetical protein